MIRNRGVLLPVFVAGFAALVLSILAAPVETRAKSRSTSIAKRVFVERNLQSGRELLLPAKTAETQQDVPLPEGKGKDLTQKNCTMCHASTVWAKKHYTQDQWTSVIDQMVEKGLVASDEDIATMTGYLAANFGPAKKDVPATPPPSQ